MSKQAHAGKPVYSLLLTYVGDGAIYSAQAPSIRSAADYTARVIPDRDGVAVPLEAARILWQR
jgi:starch phosphorylase